MIRKEKFEKRKRELWVYILGYYVDHNYMPLLREIAENAFTPDKLTREGARYILKGLEKDGRIKINSKKRRGIVLVSETEGGVGNDKN